jgi:hypothetical protein
VGKKQVLFDEGEESSGFEVEGGSSVGSRLIDES